MRDLCTELECCGRCAAGWGRRRAALDAMHARFTRWCGWLAGATIVVCAARVALVVWAT